MGYGQVTAHERNWPVEAIRLRAAAARVKGDLVRISTGHADGVNADLTLADDTNVYRIAVALEDAASGATYMAAYKGTVTVTVPSATYTAGNGLRIFDGAIDEDGTAQAYDDLSTNTHFGLVAVGGTTVTSITATLYGDRVTAAT